MFLLNHIDTFLWVTGIMVGVCTGMTFKIVWLRNKEDIYDREKMLARKEAFSKALEAINSPLTDEAMKNRSIERLLVLSFIEGQRKSGGWTTQRPEFVFEQMRIAIQNGVHAWDFDVKAAATDREVL